MYLTKAKFDKSEVEAVVDRIDQAFHDFVYKNREEPNYLLLSATTLKMLELHYASIKQTHLSFYSFKFKAMDVIVTNNNDIDIQFGVIPNSGLVYQFLWDARNAAPKKRLSEQFGSLITDINTEINKGKQYGDFASDFASDHEMYAVLLEEVEEVWHEIKNNKVDGFKDRLRKELVQVAAVAIRAIQELDEATCQKK